MTSVLLEPVASIVDAPLSTSKNEIISSSSLPSDSEAINLLMGLLESSTSKAPVSRKRRSDVGSSGVMVEGGHSQSAMNKSLRTQIEHSSPNHHHHHQHQQQQHDTQGQQQHVTSPSAASTTTTISVASNATLASRRSSLSTQRLNGESDVSTNSSPLGSRIHSFDDLTDLDHVLPNGSVLLPPPSTIVSSVVVPLPAPDSTSGAAVVVVAPSKPQPTKRRKKATSSSADSVTHASSFTSVATKAHIGTAVNSATPTSRPAKTTPTKRPPALALPVVHTHAQSIVPMNAPPSSSSSYSSYPHLAIPQISSDSNAARHATIAHNIYRHQHEAHVVSDLELAPVAVHGNGLHSIVSPLHPSLPIDLTELAPSGSSSPAILPSQMAPSSLAHPSTHASISAFRSAELPMETLALPLATSIPAHFQHEPMQLTQLIQQQQPQPQQLQQQLDPYYQQQLEQQLHHQHQQQQLQLQLHHEEQIYQQQLYHQQQQQQQQQHHPQFPSPSMFSSPPNSSVQYYSPSHSLPAPSSISQPAQEHFQAQPIYSYQPQHAHPQSITYYPTEHPSHPIDLQSQFNANLQLQHQQSLPSPSYGYY